MDKDTVIVPDGTSIYTLASSGDIPRSENLPTASTEISFVSGSWLKKKYSCTHRGPRKFELSVYGVTVNSTKHNDLCPECLIFEVKKTVTRCAMCALPIFPGSGVCVYHPTSPGVDLALANFIDPNTVLGCMRWDCCTHPGLFAGHWTEKGFKQCTFSDDD